MSTLDQLEAKTWARFAPPPRITLSEWADRERILAAESSAEPGRWRTSRVPYLREPMDVISDRHVETVVIMASAQVGKTEVLLNLVGYHMDLDPCPIMFVEPTLEMAMAISKDRIAPMIEATPRLKEVAAKPRTRNSSSTLLHRTFPGGALTLAGANSPASLASRPIRIVLCDEVDRWPASVGSEGDPMSLIWKRTTTFRRRKGVLVSSPTNKDASRIEDWWNLSDQRRYHTPCPRCGVRFVIAWSHVRFEDRDPSTAHLACPHCRGRIEDHERPAMMTAGAWVAERPFEGIAGFHIWEMFSPWRTLADQVRAFLQARHSLEMRQAWTNTSLGLPWEVPGERIEAKGLLLRREAYATATAPAVLPDAVQVITMGADTQDDRLEALVMGWGPLEECWVLARETFYGDPAREEVWRDFDETLTGRFAYADGTTLGIYATLIDSAGHKTQAIYRAVMARKHRRVEASIGRNDGEKGLIVSPRKRVRLKDGTGSAPYRVVGVDQLKTLITSRLRVADPGPEYVHFPQTVGEIFFEELTAEKLITKRNKYGVPTKVWTQVRDRNETFDCFVLGLAALRMAAPTPARFQQLAALLARQRGNAGPASLSQAPAGGAPAPAPDRPIAPRAPWLPRRTNWLRRDT